MRIELLYRAKSMAIVTKSFTDRRICSEVNRVRSSGDNVRAYRMLWLKTSQKVMMYDRVG